MSAARRTLFTLPQNEAIEMPGHPNVAFELRDYGRIDGTVWPKHAIQSRIAVSINILKCSTKTPLDLNKVAN